MIEKAKSKSGIYVADDRSEECNGFIMYLNLACWHREFKRQKFGPKIATYLQPPDPDERGVSKSKGAEIKTKSHAQTNSVQSNHVGSSSIFSGDVILYRQHHASQKKKSVKFRNHISDTRYYAHIIKHP